MTTKTWTGGTGNYAVGTNWSDGKAPLAGDTGIFAAGTIQLGASELAPSTTLLISNGDYQTELHLELSGSTLDGSIHTDAVAGGNGDAEAYDIGGTVTLNGEIAGAQQYGLIDFNDLAGPGTLVVSSSGVISSASADLNLGVSTLVDNGDIRVFNAFAYVSSETVTGTGTFTLTRQPVGAVPNTNSVSFAHGVGSGVTVAFGGNAGGDGELILSDPTEFAATITGFTADTDIELNGIQADAATLDNGKLVVSNAGVTVASLSLVGSFAGFTVDHTSRFGGTDTFDSFIRAVACFAAGTRIATARGDVAVEDLQVGESVVVCDAVGTAPIIWVGHRHIDLRRHPRPHDVMPVRVQRDAFAPGMPQREAWFSPDHSVFVDGVLIPVRYLVNGRTIAQESRDAVSYWHVELARHHVLLAEGLPCESFLDTGNRSAFANGGPAIQLHADFAMGVWQAQACAPLVRAGAKLAAARRSLLERATRLGHATTGEPDVRASAHGRVLRAKVAGTSHSFRLPARTDTIRLLSRSSVPAEIREDSDDDRKLGVAVSRVALDGQALALTDARLLAGWHAAEYSGAEPAWRWTDGDAVIASRGARTLELEIAITERYWAERTAA